MNNSSGSDEMQLANNDDNSIDSWDDDSFAGAVQLDEQVLNRLRNKDPELTGMEILIRDQDMTSSIDWETEGIHISEKKNLTSLYLDEWSANPNEENIKALLRAISCNKSIQCVDIGQCSIDSGDMIEILVPFFKNNAKLRVLHMCNLDLNDKSAQLLSSALTSCAGSLRRLDLHSNGVISNMSAGRIVASLDSHRASLRELILDLNNNEKQWCIELGKLLQNPTSKLEDLNLGHCQICNEGAFFLGGAIAQSKLKKIHLNEIESITSLGWIALASGIVACSSLEEVEAIDNDDHISHNQIGDEVAVVLANALVVNPSLAVLDISRNSMGDAGALAIAYALAKNTTLKSLDLSGNRSVSIAGWRTFFSIFRTNNNNNSSLERLLIANNNIEDEGLVAIIDTFGTTLKHLSLSHNPITIDGFRTLATLIQRPGSCLKELYISPVRRIIDEVMLSFANALVNNTTMINLYLDIYSQNIFKCFSQQRYYTNLTVSKYSKRTSVIHDNVSPSNKVIIYIESC